MTILEPLMPWTVSAIFMATTLGVPTLEYLPWTIFCMTGWMFLLAFGRVLFAHRVRAEAAAVSLRTASSPQCRDESLARC